MTYILQLKKDRQTKINGTASEGSDFETSPHGINIINIGRLNVFCFSYFQISLHYNLANHPNLTTPSFQSTVELSASQNGNSIYPLQAQHRS